MTAQEVFSAQNVAKAIYLRAVGLFEAALPALAISDEDIEFTLNAARQGYWQRFKML